MKRKALIIGSPGNEGEKFYLPGVEVDFQAYVAFLKSPLGGAWRDDEIIAWRNPSDILVRIAIRLQADADFSMTVFCGHGYHDEEQDSTYVVLEKDVNLDSTFLRRGASKHILVLDCCRELQPTPKMESFREVTAAAQPSLSATECRLFYDQAIEQCANGLVVLHGCAVDEVSNEDSEDGGYYSNGLISAAKGWLKRSKVDTRTDYEVLSITSAHDLTVKTVHRLSGERQNPKIERPRTEKQFPFAVIA
jgi:hypothetical protein